MIDNTENELEKLSGEVDAIIFRSEETGFCVFMLKTEDDLVNVVGELGNIEEGEEVVCTGKFVDHPKFGEQFRCEYWERSLPTTAAAIRKYLASGAIKGIGPAKAKAIVKKFGDKTIEIIEKSPERLAEVDGINPKKAEDIAEQFKKLYAVRMLSIFFAEYDIPMSMAVKAFKRWGDNSEMLIRSNPYILCISGVGISFGKADAIASKLGIPQDSDMRISAGITDVLKTFNNEGHTCLPIETLARESCRLLGTDKQQFDRVLTDLLADEQLFRFDKDNGRYIMLADHFRAENFISRRLTVMRSFSYDNKIDFSEVIDKAEQDSGIKYEELQRKAINLALSYGFLVITGGPGTGKTTTLNAIIDLFKQQGKNVMLAAPTGRAAKRLSDITGCEAKTIHRLLEVKPGGDDIMTYIHDEKNLLDCDALIIDEMSMVDTLLFEAVLRGISMTCKLVLVGDSDQLPSVGAGNVLRDIIGSGVMPVVRLTQIFRQAQQSAIVTNAHKIVNGQHIDLHNKENDFFFMQRLDYQSLQQLTSDLCRKRLPDAYGFSPFEDIQVLSPTRQGPAGTSELNSILQNSLNPKAAGKSEVSSHGTIFRIGDKVMQTKNNYDLIWHKKSGGKTESGAGIFNGDIGRITSCNRLTKQLTVDFDGRETVYESDMLSDLELAYAITVHKSQGSEYDAVILVVFRGFDKLYYRNLLYTAVTRAKKLLIIVGDNERIDFMIDNCRRNERFTCLTELLKEMNSDDAEQTEVSLL